MLEGNKNEGVRKVQVDDTLSNQTCVIIVGENMPEQDIIERERLAFDGYKIPILKEEDINEIKNEKSLLTKRYFEPVKNFELTYDRLFNLEYSPFAHLNFRASESPLRGRKIYFPAGKGEGEDLKQYLEEEGVTCMGEFDPKKADYCLLTEETLESLKQGERDKTILEIEYKYNQSSSEKFRCLFLRIEELIFSLLQSAKGKKKKKLVGIYDHCKNKLCDIKIPQSVFHYTDMNALSNILKDGKINLRASNILYLNDKKEAIEGLDIAKDIVESFKKQKKSSPSMNRLKTILGRMKVDDCHEYYVTSFCKYKDDMAMWGMYADNGKGCALKFNSSKISEAFNDLFVKCNYNAEETCALYISIVMNTVKKGRMSRTPKAISNIDALKICLSAKDKSFRYENEWRGILDIKGTGKIPEFRLKNNYQVPYVSIEIPKEALQRIVVGPLVDDFSIQSIKNLLKVRGFGHVKVEKSKIPYRG